MILNNAENGEHMDMILIDLHKAFDTWNHKTLLHKMKCMGFPDKAMKWFHSYLTNKAFFVSISTVIWEAGTINYRVLRYWDLCCFCYIRYSAGSVKYSYIPVCTWHKDLLSTQGSYKDKKSFAWWICRCMWLVCW